MDFPVPGILQYVLLCLSAEHKSVSHLKKIYTNNILLHGNVPE